MRPALEALAGAAVLSGAAVAAASFPADSTPIDRAFPLLAVAIWVLALLISEGRRRAAVLILLVLAFAAEVTIADAETRLLILGGIVASTGTLYVSSLPARWMATEILGAFLLTGCLRISPLSGRTIVLQSAFVLGAVVLWQILRRRRAHPWIVAGSVLLLAVSIPSVPERMALVPWILAGFAWVSNRDGWVAQTVIALLSLVVAKWLFALFVLVETAEVLARRGRAVGGSPLFVPAAAAVPANLSRALLPVVFFPSLAVSIRTVIPVAAALLLAAIVRPSLGPAIVVAGIVMGCVRRDEPQHGQRKELWYPSLMAAFVILALFPWSGAITARPPSPFAATPVLVIAALALLPPVFRRATGVVALLLLVPALTVLNGGRGDAREVGRWLVAGESTSIEIGPGENVVAVRIAGSNLAEARNGEVVGRIGLVDSDGGGHARPIRIGEIADWGAFRPAFVLGTWNPRPDEVARVEEFGVEAWVRGSGTIRIDGVAEPRWIVITASEELGADQSLIIEEVVVR